MQEDETVEIRNFCPSCPPGIRECTLRTRTPKKGLSPEMLKLVEERGYMASHDSCSAHFHEELNAIKEENREIAEGGRE